MLCTLSTSALAGDCGKLGQGSGHPSLAVLMYRKPAQMNAMLVQIDQAWRGRQRESRALRYQLRELPLVRPEAERLVRDAAQLDVDLFLVASSLEANILRATDPHNRPIIYLGTGDPRRSGMAKSLDLPGNRATGIVSPALLEAKQIETLALSLPNARRFGLISLTGYPLPDYRAMLQDTARRYGKEILFFEFDGVKTREQLVSTLQPRKLDGAIVQPSAFLIQNAAAVIGAMEQLAIPAIYPSPDHLRAGGTMSLHYVRPDYVAGITELLVKIDCGVDPGTIPIQRPSQVSLAINAKAVQRYSSQLSPSIWTLADQIISPP